MKNLETVLLLNLCLILEHSTSLKNKLNPTEAKISSQSARKPFQEDSSIFVTKAIFSWFVYFLFTKSIFFFYYASKFTLCHTLKLTLVRLKGEEQTLSERPMKT